MNTRFKWPSGGVLAVWLATMLGACSTSDTQSVNPATATASITGTATYRERMMLPPDAMLEVTLEDVSRADAPADIIALITVQVTKGPPYSFSLGYDPARINPQHRYNVRARITVDGKPMFQSDAGYAVLGTGNVTHVDILMRRASAETSQASSASQQTRGMYSYMADAGWFVDCRSGVRLAVAQEGDNAALETAYSKARSMDGVPMLATVEGRVEDRMPMEGPGPRPTLVVEKFISVDAGQGCSGPSSTAQLENTYWKFMTLDGKSIESPEGARELHIVLNSQNQRVTGFPGCNRMTGSYQLKDDKITFTQMAGTMMACVSGMDTERQIHEMFARVAGWKIAGETLQFTDSNGTVLATFESRYMK
jgi:uncharacterized lipoprotein YbaY/heat shock protein HslJ